MRLDAALALGWLPSELRPWNLDEREGRLVRASIEKLPFGDSTDGRVFLRVPGNPEREAIRIRVGEQHHLPR